VGSAGRRDLPPGRVRHALEPPVRAAVPGRGWRSGPDAVQHVYRVAAEDLLDVGGGEPAVSEQPGQAVELVVAGQDGPVVAVQVGADGHVAGADHFGEPEGLGGEVGQAPAGDAARPGADQAPGRGDRGHVLGAQQPRGVPYRGGRAGRGR
jgi:hypothetical protein